MQNVFTLKCIKRFFFNKNKIIKFKKNTLKFQNKKFEICKYTKSILKNRKKTIYNSKFLK